MIEKVRMIRSDIFALSNDDFLSMANHILKKKGMEHRTIHHNNHMELRTMLDSVSDAIRSLTDREVYRVEDPWCYFMDYDDRRTSDGCDYLHPHGILCSSTNLRNAVDRTLGIDSMVMYLIQHPKFARKYNIEV